MQFSIEEKERYSRHFILEGFGTAGQEKLKQARVLVVGAGGLGCPVLQYLAAAGVGYIGIADFDIVSLSNLQRQVLYTTEDIGKPKVHIAQKRLNAINPDITITIINQRIDAGSALDVLKDYNVIVDATDNFATRYLLNDACVILKKPLVYGAIFRFEGQVSVFNLDDGPTYRCLFETAPSPEDMPACSDAGVLGVLPGIIGTWQATETIKVITGIGEPLKGKLLVFDLLTNEVSRFKISTVPEHKNITTLGTYEEQCSLSENEIDKDTLKQWQAEKNIQLLDVREAYEYNRFNIGAKNLPLSSLGEQLNEIDPGLITVVHCQSGVRARKAIQQIKSVYPSIEIYQLKNGLNDFYQAKD
jgi:adenylyltransferase/sulfurtransferase